MINYKCFWCKRHGNGVKCGYDGSNRNECKIDCPHKCTGLKRKIKAFFDALKGR